MPSLDTFKRKLGGQWYMYLPDHPDAAPSGYIQVRRVLMEETLGRRLNRNELVIHKNGQKDDDRLENLELVDRAERLIHAPRRAGKGRRAAEPEYQRLVCFRCNTPFLRKIDKRTHAHKPALRPFCSQRCSSVRWMTPT